ncbi:MAG TPA: iron-containing redox enzyme family protein [Micromonosporaceae bacterium]
MPTLTVADTTTSLPVRPFEFAPQARQPARDLLASPPVDLLGYLLREQESQVALLVARHVIEAFRAAAPEAAGFAPPLGADAAEGLDAQAIASRTRDLAAQLAAALPELSRDRDVADAVLRQRAPLALLGGCWLDTVSQPATQPAVAVNLLFGQYFRLQGEGNPRQSVSYLRHRALEQAGVFLPDVDANDFFAKAQTRPLTALHGLWYLSLARLPANFLPEVVGVHYAYYSLGVDDRLLALPPLLDQSELDALLAEYLALTRGSATGAADRRRLVAAIELTAALEREHVALLAEVARREAALPLEARVAAIIERHAPFAGRQHRDVRVAGQRLTDVFADPDFDVAGFVRTLRQSRQLKPIHGGDGRFLRAIKFGGPMFGIFDQREAEVFQRWAEQAAAGVLPDIEVPPNRCGDQDAARWLAAIARTELADVTYVEAKPADHRELFHRIVNIESFPNTLPLARSTAEETLSKAEVLFGIGAQGRYTDASYFDYSPDALLDRVDRVYWDKLVNPYRPLTEIPDRDEVIFGQKTFALGSLIDGTWAHRIGNVGRNRRHSDGMLAAIYADEMGRGDIRKNHITLIYQVLSSMDIHLPHIRDDAFKEQAELPDHLYGFSIHQICLALFPDTFYNEILGYNLGIEMFGLGEMRMHEMQKLEHHGFDPIYEQAHLSIDNFSAGHARQSADLIIAYLDDVARTFSDRVVQAEWRRIWRGYASFAYFIEHALVRSATAARTGELVI